MKKGIILPLVSICTLLILLTIPGLIFYIIHTSFINFIYALLVPLTVFLIPLFLFRKVIRWYTAFIGIFILISPLATFPVIYFGDLVGKDMLVITFNTTYHEASELMRGYLLIFAIIYVIYIILLVLAIKWLPSRLSVKRSVIISVSALFLIISITAIRYGSRPLIHNIKGVIYTYYPFHFIYACYTFYKQQVVVKNSEKQIRNSPYKNVTNGNRQQRQVYVLLIGESSRFDHWEINGYNRPTSPLLMHQKRLLNFRDVVASGCLTELAVPQILTGVNAEDYREHLRQGGIFQLFHQAGYKTYWLSNQTDKGNIRMHASLADSMVWMQNTIATNSHLYYDMDLVNSMKRILRNDTTNNCLIIIHTIGSHYDYTERYPKLFGHFLPVWSINMFTPTERSKKNELVNAYDNTILYTSVVIDSVINFVNRLNCVSAVLYTSDHGENLFDDSRNLVLHAPIPPSKYIAHVPFFIYCSENYIEEFSQKWKFLEKHVNNKVSNNQSFETLADMADIKYKGQNIRNSLADSLFENSLQEVLGPNSTIYYYKNLK